MILSITLKLKLFPLSILFYVWLYTPIFTKLWGVQLVRYVERGKIYKDKIVKYQLKSKGRE